MHFCGFLKKISGVYYHETCRFRLLNFVLKMRQNSPTNICDFEKFPRGLYPRTPVKRGRRERGRERGLKRRTGKEREGKKVGREGWGGNGNGTGGEGREKGGDGHY
jgi:hypothetical protein